MTAKMQPFWWFKKPVITCPEGEQIVNGDFEDGITGWTFDSPNSALSTAYAQSPTHSVFTYSDGAGFHQAIDNIPVSCVKSLTFYTRYAGYAGVATIYVIVKYSDATETDIVFNNLPVDPSTPDAFTQRDITLQLSTGKVIVEIRFTSSTNNDSYIDDVSLIGTG